MEERLPSKINTFFKGVQTEWNKIVWPSGKEIRKQTGMVIAVSAALSVLIAVIDYMVKYGIELLI